MTFCLPAKNKFHQWAVCCIAVCLAVFFSVQNAAAGLISLTHFRLDNGLEVAVIENHKAPVILQMLYYKAGSVNDPKGKGGIAHLLEHMMFRGTKRLPEDMFNRLTEKYGAENNAYTTYDRTVYYEFSDISKLELMMAMEAERMRGLKMQPEAFAKERDIVLQERRQRFETNPVPLFYETLNKLLWQNSPLSNPVSGSPEEISSLTLQDAETFYNRHYRPNNALLVLAGDISSDEARNLVKKYYGSLASAKTATEKTSFSPARDMDIETSIKLSGVQQPRYVSYIRLPAGDFNKTDILALTLFSEYLAGDDTSALYDKLVYRDKKLLGIDVDVSYDANLGGVLAFYATPDINAFTATETGSMLRRTKKLIAAALAEAETELSAEKLEKIKNRVLADTVYLQENPQSAADFAGKMLTAGYTPEEIMNYDEAIRNISGEQILSAWKKALAQSARVTGWLEGK